MPVLGLGFAQRTLAGPCQRSNWNPELVSPRLLYWKPMAEEEVEEYNHLTLPRTKLAEGSCKTNNDEKHCNFYTP